MVYRCIVLPVAAGKAGEAGLCGCRTEASVLRDGQLLRCWTRLNSAVAAIEAHAVAGVAHYGAVDIGGVNDGGVYIKDRGVIGEAITVPASAVEAVAKVAVAVVDAAIEAYLRRPVTGVPGIASVVPSPVAGGPEETGLGGRNPGSRNPVVVIISPRPVAGGPYIVRLRANTLHINGQLRRSDGDRYSYLGRDDAGQDKKRGD